MEYHSSGRKLKFTDWSTLKNNHYHHNYYHNSSNSPLSFSLIPWSLSSPSTEQRIYRKSFKGVIQLFLVLMKWTAMFTKRWH